MHTVRGLIGCGSQGLRGLRQEITRRTLALNSFPNILTRTAVQFTSQIYDKNSPIGHIWSYIHLSMWEEF